MRSTQRSGRANADSSDPVESRRQVNVRLPLKAYRILTLRAVTEGVSIQQLVEDMLVPQLMQQAPQVRQAVAQELMELDKSITEAHDKVKE